MVKMGEEKELTILFADVVGSTNLYDVLGDSKARDAVSYCVEVMTSATQAHNGTVIKTMGDEVMATFVSVDDAIDAAAQMQESISDELVVDDVPVSIRIGCHYGPAIVEPNDVFGNAVNTASRMTSQAKSGQIITTLSTVNRLSEQWQSATRQIDLATVKGKKDEIALFEVLWKREDITSMVPSLSWDSEDNPGELTLRYKNQEVLLNDAKPVVHLGRADDNDLVVNNHLISRLHCRVELTRGKIRIIDESTNGTFILNNKGQELFVRRDSLRLEGEGFIGLGKVVQPDSPHAIYFAVKE